MVYGGISRYKSENRKHMDVGNDTTRDWEISPWAEKKLKEWKGVVSKIKDDRNKGGQKFGGRFGYYKKE